MQGLRDIKEVVIVPDTSLYLFIALVFLALTALSVAVYFLVKYLKCPKAKNVTKEALEALKSLEYEDAKAFAYGFSKHTKLCVGQDKQEKLASLEERLLMYKYKKETPCFDEAFKKELKAFIGGLK